MAVAWPLIGREQQLASIASAMGSPTTHGIVVVGASGLGKTRLATEALRRAAAHGAATVWAVATRAAASIPFGPLAHLLPDSAGDVTSRLDLLRHAGQALRERAQGRPMVLGIDDAHLLDDASAALVHHLVTTSTAFVVATVRTGEAAPDAVSALWKDGFAEWLELAPLSRPEVVRLVESVVGGQVDADALRRLERLSLGNPLFLRELVAGALDSGALAEVGGVWRARGPLATSTRLVEVIRARLGRLAPEVRAVAEVVAVGEPLGVALLEALVAPGDLDATDRAGLLQVVPDPRRTLVRLAHPLYGELLRATIMPLRARAIPRRLAAALAEQGARRREDLLRLASWQLEGGARPDPAVLVPAARRALSLYFDPRLAERLATAAVEADGGFAARLAQAEAVYAQGRAAEAERQFGVLPALAASDDDVARVALLRADNLVRGLGRSEQAQQVLDAAEGAVVSPRWRDELAVQRAGLAIVRGGAEEAAALARRVLERDGARRDAVLRALAAAVAADAFRGRLTDARAGAQRAMALAGGLDGEVSLAYDRVLTLLALAQTLAGELAEAERLSLGRHALALERRADAVRAGWAVVFGELALAQGQAATAVRWLQEGAAGSREHILAFGGQGLSWCLGTLAQAAAVAGDTELAVRALAEAEQVTPEDRFVPPLSLGRAWVAAAQGDLGRARTLALVAADDARARGCGAFEAVALHDVARLDGAGQAAGRLAVLTPALEGPLPEAMAEHAAALAGAAAARLEAVSVAFEGLGAGLLAAEAAAAAARQHRADGRASSALAAAGRARMLARHCGEPRTPGLALPDDARTELTQREQQIAAFAAQGLSSRAIAGELVLSVRTVDNHLRNAYAKLGIRSRDELGNVL